MSRGPLLAAIGVATFAAVLLALVLTREAEEAQAPQGAVAEEAGPVHVHGLGVNPKDGALFVATHTGLWRVGAGERRAARVGDRQQDTMGFTVVGPDRFLGSGHPDARDDLPPLLGLIESDDAGRTWEPVSLLGEADFHVLRAAGERVYGYDAGNGRLLISRDRGRTWSAPETPGALLDLAADPSDPRHLLATGERGLVESRDEGQSWRPLGERLGFLAWPARGSAYLVDGSGAVATSRDGGRTWQEVGSLGGEPAALLATSATHLYAAVHDGTILQSRDGGRTWTVRAPAA